MISHINTTLEAFLRETLPINHFNISFDTPTKEWAGQLPATKSTIDIFLYDIFENRELRDNEWVEQQSANGSTTKSRPPVRIDLFYAITAWSPAQTDAVLEEHHLLGKILAELLRHSAISSKYFQGELADISPPPEIPILVAFPEAFKDQGLGQFWSAVDQHWKPPIHLKVTIPIDLQEKITRPMVRTREVRYEQKLSTSGG